MREEVALHVDKAEYDAQARRSGPGPPCEPCHWRLRWSPSGATILARGAPKWPEAAVRIMPLGPS
eukprot:1790320-Pyramimonas_sp.AAC.1